MIPFLLRTVLISFNSTFLNCKIFVHNSLSSIIISLILSFFCSFKVKHRPVTLEVPEGTLLVFAKFVIVSDLLVRNCLSSFFKLSGSIPKIRTDSITIRHEFPDLVKLSYHCP